MKPRRLLFIRCKLQIKLLLVLFMISNCPVWAVSYDLMLDASGSMLGFQKKPETWKKLITSMESSARHKYQFGNKNNFMRVKGSLLNVRLRDKNTYLGQALRDWLSLSKPKDVVVIITDNVADTRNSSKSQKLLYDLLSKPDSAFSHIAIFPMKLAFKGRVYPGKRHYKGKRALSIYAIARDFSDKDFKKLRQDIEAKLAQFESHYIQIKPFDNQTVSGLVGDIEIDPSSSGNVKFENGRLVVSGLNLGSAMNFSFKIKIQSTNSFELENVELTAKLDLTRGEDMKHITMADKFTTTVSPRFATISPKSIKDITIDFANKPFNFNELSFTEKLAFTMKNSLEIPGNLDIEFKANRENINLSEGIINTWSYEGNVRNIGNPKVSVQGKVFKLGDLVRRMMPDNNIQKLYSVPVTLELRYPLWPIFVIIVVVLLPVIGFLYWISTRQPKEYFLEDDMGDRIDLALGFAQVFRHYSGEGNLIFALSYYGIGFWVSTPFKLRSSRFIGSGQNIRLFDAENDDEYSWQLREVKEDVTPDNDDNDDWL